MVKGLVTAARCMGIKKAIPEVAIMKVNVAIIQKLVKNVRDPKCARNMLRRWE